MTGNLSIDKQMSILRRIWGGDSSGYVFLPWIPGDKQTKEERTTPGVWQEVSFKWPEEQDKITAHLRAHDADDLFFCPNLFESRSRSVQTVAWNQRTLYADLDGVDPRKIEDQYKPTMAWQTSETGYHAVWIMGKDGLALSDEGGENHRLTVYLGADKTGWDCTQLLRVPGRVNHKRDKLGQQGTLLWDNGPRYNDADDFANLPEVRVVTVDEDVDDAIIGSIDRREAWRKLRMKVSTRCRDYMGIRTEQAAREASETIDEGMSGLLWYVERELADAGATVAEIVAIVRPMAWNKFKGRHDELIRLKTEASKAVAHARDRGGAALEDAVGDAGDVSVSLDAFMSETRPRPSWLVDRIWAKGTVGFIAGAPKSYKSWMALDLAVSVATGSKFLGVFSTTQGRVLYIQEEDSEIEVHDRVGKVFWGKSRQIHPWGWMDGGNGAGGGIQWNPPQGDRLMRLIVRKGLDLTSAEWQGTLAEQCEEHDYDLIIIDTLGTTSGDTDTDRSREVNKALKPLKILAGQYGCAIAVVHHFSKSGSAGTNGVARGGHKMLGSVALHAWVESALYVGEKEKVRDRVWGVRVERESKGAQDMHFLVEIGLMGAMTEDQNGEMVGNAGWSPIVDLRKKAIETEAESNEREKGVNLNGHHKVEGSSRTPAWRKIVRNLNQGAATQESRALSIADIIERFYGEGNITRQTVSRHLDKAVGEGYVCKIGEGRGSVSRYYACKKP